MKCILQGHKEMRKMGTEEAKMGVWEF